MRMAIAAVALLVSPALADDEGFDRLRVFYSETWVGMPASCRFRSGTVKVSGEQWQKFELPADLGNEVIRLGRLRAHAAACGLKEEHEGLLCAFAKRHSERLSPRRMIFARELNRTVVTVLTSDVSAEGEVAKMKHIACTAKTRTQVKALVDGYLAKVPEWKEACVRLLPERCSQ